MSRRQRIDCPHERRPGMALCLHCLHEARVAARDRRNRAIMRFTAWTLSLTVVGVVGTAAANAVTRKPEAPPPRRVAKAAVRQPDTAAAAIAAAPVMQQGAPAAAPTPNADSAAHPSATPAPAAVAPIVGGAVAPPAVRIITPIIPAGRTELPDSLYAERRADTVVVHFDTSPARTRRADKFEAIVRQTLRSVYGAVADTALAAVAAGRLIVPNELLTVLPTRGLHLAAPNGARIVLWPETRPGRDGLLVVAYRTTVER